MAGGRRRGDRSACSGARREAGERGGGGEGIEVDLDAHIPREQGRQQVPILAGNDVNGSSWLFSTKFGSFFLKFKNIFCNIAVVETD